MEKYSISLEVEKRLMMDQLFEQLADQLDVDVNLLTFWLVTLKNKVILFKIEYKIIFLLI